MSVPCSIILVFICTTGDGLDEARSLLRQGLLRQAEQQLVPLLANESDTRRRSHMLLLLGNVSYERGLYARALEHYVQAERDSAGDPSLAAAASGNRNMAEQRLARSREFASLAARLRVVVTATGLLAGVVLTWLASRSRIRDQT